MRGYQGVTMPIFWARCRMLTVRLFTDPYGSRRCAPSDIVQCWIKARTHHVDEIVAVEPAFDPFIHACKAVIEALQRVATAFDMREI